MVVVVNPTVLQGHNSYWGQLLPGLIGGFGEKLLGNMFPTAQDRYYNALAENANEGRKYRTEIYEDNKLRGYAPDQGYSQQSDINIPSAAEYTTGQAQENWYKRPLSTSQGTQQQAQNNVVQFPPQKQQQERVSLQGQPMATPSVQQGQENYWYNKQQNQAKQGAGISTQGQQRQYQQSQPSEQPSPVQQMQAQEQPPNYMEMVRPKQRVISEEEQQAFEQFKTQQILSNPNPVIPPAVGQQYLTDRQRIVLGTLSNMTYGQVDDKALARLSFTDNQMKNYIDAGAMQYGITANMIDMGLFSSTVNVAALMNKQASGIPLTKEEQELMVSEQTKVNTRIAAMSDPERAYFYSMMFGTDGKSGLVQSFTAGGFLQQQLNSNMAIEKMKDQTSNRQIDTYKEVSMKQVDTELQKIFATERMSTAQIAETRRQFDDNLSFLKDKQANDVSYQSLSIALGKYTIDKQAQIQSQAAAVGVKMQQAQIALGIYGVDSQTIGRHAVEQQAYNRMLSDQGKVLDDLRDTMSKTFDPEEKARLGKEYAKEKGYYDNLKGEYETKRESWKTDGTQQTYDQILRGVQMKTSTQGLSLSPDELEPFVPVGWKNVSYKGIAQRYLQYNKIPTDQEFLADMTEYGTKHNLPKLDPQDPAVSRLRQLVVDEINYQNSQAQPVFGITGMDSQSPPPSPTVEKPVDTGKKTPPPATGKGSPTGQSVKISDAPAQYGSTLSMPQFKQKNPTATVEQYIQYLKDSGSYLDKGREDAIRIAYNKPVVSQVGQPQQGQQKWDTRIDKYGSDLRGYFWTIGINYTPDDFISTYERKYGTKIPTQEQELLRRHFRVLQKQYQTDWATKPSAIAPPKYVK